ncbi:predicted protein [Chaetomium globosum CBS 148.51]|uniref:Uncharacterized protein n=1 Tax=Chaetomium globosum (strain ATCC 6205 / CBS 148.51 / DSM 1962 / NBRC 6347 / NRRL 1970) TaxID=306901 RepID=Q2HHD7_CHAGB|nr:uncharacterized protein CHGG_00367 [Chaetomium globosum CBS 148.51]EAQ92132.1 predicted protein [Chaetomium globosum CBS 148.51]
MGCGLFGKKKSKKTGGAGGAGFAPRPVQQTVQGGKVGYQPTEAALANQKKYQEDFRKQYGGDPNDPEFVRSLAANQALAGSAANFAVRKMGPQGQRLEPYAQRGANMAATQFTKQQFRDRQQQED